MKEGWTYKKLGEVCELYQPKTISTKEMVPDGEFDVFGANGIIGKYDQYNHEHSEILMTCRGATCGNINISTPKSWINGNAMVVHIKDDTILNRAFLVYALSFIDKKHIITGAAQPQITRQTLSPLTIAFPCLSEQLSIVSRLDAAFAHIDVLKANAEKQLAEARQLFQAELAECMKPKEGWEEKALGEVSVFSQGIQVDVNLQTEICSPGKVRFLRIIDVTQGNVPPRYIDDPGEKYYLKADEIAMVRYGTVGFVCYGFEGVIANNLFKISIKDKSKLQSNYLQYFLKSDLFQSNIRKGVGGAALPAIKFGDIKYIMLGFPPLSEQQRIVSRLDALSANIKKLEEVQRKTLAECDALKQAMLREVFE